MSSLALFRWELYKLFRRRSSYVGFLLSALFCVVILAIFNLAEFGALPISDQEGGDAVAAQVNGYYFATAVLYLGSELLLPLLAVVAAGSQIAGEAQEGTLRMLLLRPPSRVGVLLVKALVTQLWMFITVYFLLGCALTVGFIALGGGGDAVVFLGAFDNTGPLVSGRFNVLSMFVLTGFGVGCSLFVFTAAAIAFSAVTDNPVVAHVNSLGVFIISALAERLSAGIVDDAVRAILPTTHLGFWRQLYWLFSTHPERFDASGFSNDLVWCAVCAAICLTIGLLAFVRRDIES